MQMNDIEVFTRLCNLEQFLEAITPKHCSFMLMTLRSSQYVVWLICLP
jgi:hypothetical protein